MEGTTYKLASRPYLTVHDVMLLLGVKTDKAYQFIREINEELVRQGYMGFASGKVNKHVFREKFLLTEEEIEDTIRFVDSGGVKRR